MFTPDTSHVFFQAPETMQPKTLEEALSVIASLTAARDNAEKAWARLVAENAGLASAKYRVVGVGPDEFTFEAEDAGYGAKQTPLT